MDSAFDQISKYCLDNDIDFPIRNQAYAIYTVKLQDAICNHKQQNNGKITPKEELAIQNMLISEVAIKDNIIAAQQIITSIQDAAIEPYKKSFNWGEFWVSVGASIVGAFIFSVLIIGLVFVSQEQIKSVVAPILYEEATKQGDADSE